MIHFMVNGNLIVVKWFWNSTQNYDSLYDAEDFVMSEPLLLHVTNYQ